MRTEALPRTAVLRECGVDRTEEHCTVAPMQPRWRISHAHGYLGLGMVAEAAAELDALPPDRARDSEVLSLRAAIFQHQENWPELASIAASLANQQPDDPGWWITWAYATRRAISLPAAEEILRAAARLHPKEPTIAFNLGCYACQQGDLTAARAFVDRAISLDNSFAELAAKDPDLAPLRASSAS